MATVLSMPDSFTQTIILKARLHRRVLSQQLNAIFVVPKLQPAAILLRF